MLKSNPANFDNHKAKNSKTAFSLIELSTVLIIIGILIAGIISGKSLMRNSALSAAKAATLASPVVSIPGMVAWFETSTKDSFLKGENVDGHTISVWNNINPANFLSANKLSIANGVVYKEDGINNLPSVSFNGSANIKLINFDGYNLTNPTVIIVFRPNAINNSNVILDSGASTSSTCSVGFSSTVLNLDAGTPVSIAATFTINTPYISLMYFNGANSKPFVNSSTSLGTFNLGANELNGLTIGSDKNDTSW